MARDCERAFAERFRELITIYVIAGMIVGLIVGTLAGAVNYGLHQWGCRRQPHQFHEVLLIREVQPEAASFWSAFSQAPRDPAMEQATLVYTVLGAVFGALGGLILLNGALVWKGLQSPACAASCFATIVGTPILILNCGADDVLYAGILLITCVSLAGAFGFLTTVLAQYLSRRGGEPASLEEQLK